MRQKDLPTSKFFICRDCNKLICAQCRRKHDIKQPDHIMVTYYISGENNNSLLKSTEINPTKYTKKICDNEVPLNENNSNENKGYQGNYAKLRNKNFTPNKGATLQIENNGDFRILGTPICCKCKMNRNFIVNIQCYYCNECMKMYCKKCICKHVTCSCVLEKA